MEFKSLLHLEIIVQAAALVVSIPVVIAGWVAQDRLVKGLSLGAVK